MTEHYPYRFKTEAEFIKEFGERWRFQKIRSGWNNDMDYLFGIPYPYYVDENKLLQSLSYWTISWDMLTENKPIAPDYTPRRKRNDKHNTSYYQEYSY